jgi:hypothetical protein
MLQQALLWPLVASIVDMVAVCNWREVGRIHSAGELKMVEEPNGRDTELKGLKDKRAVAFLGLKAKDGTGERWGRRNGGGMGLRKSEGEV